MTSPNIPEILSRYRKIAALGISPNESRPSHYVSEYMIRHGYEITGVNPGQSQVLDRPCYPSLTDVPGAQEIVAVFRASEYLDAVVDECLALAPKPKVLWIQLGIEDEAAEQKAEAGGMIVVRRHCLMVEHRNL